MIDNSGWADINVRLITMGLSRQLPEFFTIPETMIGNTPDKFICIAIGNHSCFFHVQVFYFDLFYKSFFQKGNTIRP